MGKKILIVDDATFMRMMLRDILSKDGHEIVGEAASGKQAVKEYKKNKPDLVTMDITMPEMDGIQTVKEIVKLDPKAKILMVSAMGQEKLMVEAMEAGAIDFIVKPFQPLRIQETVKKWLNGDGD